MAEETNVTPFRRERVCGNCYCFQPRRGDLGECHAAPPKLHPLDAESTAWPTTSADEFCVMGWTHYPGPEGAGIEDEAPERQAAE